ncbi:CdaR family protein [Lactobacillus sp. ESL0681]|uniref:CdaR family protein n=1 Tax=Lactobacillus sp. ESL0681 TaxID=2983211 RepID=UPI0023F7B8D0|nr:CdaR family protein [Lactobacillus sp. ESL0681]WEV40478.1 CdaR family protein [Lactobacillus sp. ESL0681]
MKAFWKKSWFISLLSLLIAVLLVIYTNYTQEGFMTQGQPERTKQTASEKQTVKVPLQVSVNTDNYYVVGYPAKVSITLEGSSALVTSAVNTQNFRVYIDLTHKSVGDHTVKVRVSGLSNQVSYKINPKSVHVNIQRRKSVTEPVQIEYNKDAVAHGYKLGKTSVYPQQVEITGARSEVDQIDQVVAKVTLPNEINHTYERQVSLIAEDKQGRQLNVIIDPATVKVTIPISVAKKAVKVDLRPQHEKVDKVYSLTAKNDYVTVYGSQEALKKVKRLKVPIDLKDVQSTTTKEVKLPLPDGVVKAEPNQISVQIKVKESMNSNNAK